MEQKELKYIIRIANTDLQGSKSILVAMKKIRGISVMLGNAILSAAEVSKTKKAGALTDSEVKRIDDVIANPIKFNIPSWMFNRRKDNETGDDKHLILGDLKFQSENDIKIMKYHIKRNK